MSAVRLQSALDACTVRLATQAESALERARSRGEAPALLAVRERALTGFREVGLPTSRWEEWRYTSLAPLCELELSEPTAAAGADPQRGLDRERLEALCEPVFACSLHVFLDGRRAPALSPPTSLASEVRCRSLAELSRAPSDADALAARLAGPDGGGAPSWKQHPFAALGTAAFEDGAWLEIARHQDVANPVHLVFAAGEGGRSGLAHPRVLVDAAAGSRAVVIVDFVSASAAASFTNAALDVRVEDAARLDLVVLQRENDAALQTCQLQARVGRSGRLVTHVLTLGGRWVRNDLDVSLAEEGAECDLRGLYLGVDDALIDNHTGVDHVVPHCRSAELYKGILGGRSRGVFRGRVVVRPGAQKTDATQSNPNLLLSAGAEIDTKPQLEIYADDVKCSHGSSIGQLDLDALFYLRSRGLSEPVARDLLTRGFAAEITEALPAGPLGERVSDLLLQRLGRAGVMS